jgi:ribonuclease-3
MSRQLALSGRLLHDFADERLLEEAFTHASAGAAHDYERLEFLGDRVLALVVAAMLIERFPAEPVGRLARRLAALVQESCLSAVAREIGLDAHVKLSPGEEQAGTRDNPAILADCCEAVIGALYVDGALRAAEGFVRRYWAPLIERDLEPPKDAKTALQEWALGLGLPLPTYVTVAVAGPMHRPTFTVEVEVEGRASERGAGHTKRGAEQAAAGRLLSRIESGKAGQP